MKTLPGPELAMVELTYLHNLKKYLTKRIHVTNANTYDFTFFRVTNLASFIIPNILPIINLPELSDQPPQQGRNHDQDVL